MDRMLVLASHVAIAQGNRVEVTERIDSHTAETEIVALNDLDAGIHYLIDEEYDGEVSRWLGRVRECRVTLGGSGGRASTRLVLRPLLRAGSEAKTALHEADAAAEAAKVEADRWGGSDRTAPEEPERFW